MAACGDEIEADFNRPWNVADPLQWQERLLNLWEIFTEHKQEGRQNACEPSHELDLDVLDRWQVALGVDEIPGKIWENIVFNFHKLLF